MVVASVCCMSVVGLPASDLEKEARQAQNSVAFIGNRGRRARIMTSGFALEVAKHPLSSSKPQNSPQLGSR